MSKQRGTGGSELSCLVVGRAAILCSWQSIVLSTKRRTAEQLRLVDWLSAQSKGVYRHCAHAQCNIALMTRHHRDGFDEDASNFGNS